MKVENRINLKLMGKTIQRILSLEQSKSMRLKFSLRVDLKFSVKEKGKIQK
jgi:hypothetical protein